MRRRLAAARLAMVLLMAGSCGIPIDEQPQSVALPENLEASPTTTPATTVPEEADGQRLYFIREGRLIARTRELTEDALAQEVFEQLFVGPTEEERELSIESRLTPDLVVEAGFLTGTNTLLLNFVNDNDPDTPFLGLEGELRSEAIAQLVFTGIVFGASGVVFAENDEWQLVANADGEVQVFDDAGVPVPLTQSDFVAFTPGG